MRTMIRSWKDSSTFVPSVGLCLILPGIQAAVCTTLGGKMPYWPMIGIYSALSLLLVIFVSLPKRWLWKACILLFAGVGIFGWKNWQDILEHAGVIAYYINQKYKTYMNQTLFPKEWCIRGDLQYNMILIGFSVLSGLYIAWTSLKLRSKLLMSMPIILTYCAALLLGGTPGQLPTLLLIIGMALEMQWITEQQKIRNSFKLRERTEQIGSGKRVFVVILILTAGLSLSWHLTSRISGRVFRNVNRIQIRQHKMEQELQTMIETKGQQLRGMLGIDSGGYLSNVAPKYLNKKVFSVTVSGKPNTSLYLRGFVGDIYQGGEWKASENIQKESGKRKGGVWKGKYSNSRYTTFDPEEQDITIQYTRLGRRSKYLYTPYRKDSDINEMKRTEGKLCLGEEDDALSLYQGLAEEMSEESFGISSDLIMDVQNVLWRNASYSLLLDPVPNGQDYAEYFLFYSQKGYCEHFATAGTLLLRNMNHEARYVSGYRIPPNRFIYNRKEKTYTAEVLDSDAHAWSEVWVQGSYWMPQEMTPSGEDSDNSGTVWAITEMEDPESNIDLQAPTEQPSLRQTPEAAETKRPKDTEAPSSDPESRVSQDGLAGKGDFGSGSGSQAHGSLGKWWTNLSRRQQVLLAASVAVIVVLLLIYLHDRGRKRRKKQRMAQMRKHNKSAYIGMRLGVFLDRLHHSGIAVQITMPEQQWLQVLSEKLQEPSDPAEMEKVAELVRRAAYSREVVSDAEVDWFDAYCNKLEGSLKKKWERS